MSFESRNPFWSSFSAALLAILLSSILSFPSQASDSKLGSMDDFWEKYDDISDWVTLRLKLTPEQEDKALPLMQENFESQMAIMEAYGIEPGKKVPELTAKQKEEIDVKITAVRTATRAEMVKILNAEQLEELVKIQQEYHQELRKRLARN